MILHQDKAKHPIRVLLDTGCSIALINEQTIKKLGIQRQKHQRPRTIENYTGEAVPGVGQYCTKALKIQHRKHFTWEQLEISPMDPEINVFLPFSWIADHPPCQNNGRPDMTDRRRRPEMTDRRWHVWR